MNYSPRSSVPHIPAWLKAALVIVIAVEVVVIGYILVSRATSGQSVIQAEEGLVVSDAAAASNNADASGSNPVQIKVTFAGDCTVGTDENFNYSTSMPAKWEDVDGDATYFLKNVASIFEDDDLTVVNMEGTLTTGGSRADKTFAFKGKPEYAKIFSSSSVEAASLANNHSKDYGTDSYTDTIEAMEAEGVQTFGYDRIAYTEIKGVKVALVGAYALNETYDYVKEMTDNIAKAREEGAQLVLVYVHWGIEKEYVPNETQMSMGHAAIDAGADLVIGSHPHVVQGYEVYQGRYIVYSLGNFCFGGNSNPSDKDCMIFQQTFTVSGEDVEKNGDVEFIACSISSSSSTNNYQPTPAEGSEKERIMKKFQESSDEIAEMAKEMS